MAEIYNEESNTLLSGTSYNDFILNGGWYNDNYYFGGSNVTIYGEAGDDSIGNKSNCDNSYIIGGVGNDLIINNGNSITISGGKDNDTIGNGYEFAGNHIAKFDDVYEYSYGKNIMFKYTSGDGDDLIYGFQSDSTLKIGEGTGTYSKKTIGDDIIVTVGDGKITLVGAVSLSAVNIDGVEKSNPLSIIGTDSADNVKETVDGATIQAIGGNDTIHSYGDDVLIDSGAGDDSIRNYGDNVTIYGGTGNDTIRNAFGENVLFNYSAGNGNDVIIGFNDSSTLKIGDGTATYSTVKSGNNIIVTAGSGKLTLAGAATLDTLNIVGTEKTYKTLKLTDKSSAKINLSAAYAKVNGMNRTTAIQITGNSLDNTISGGIGNDTLSGGAGSDSLLGSNGNDKLYGGSGDDTLFGGMGNDSLWGQAGADTFLYTEGTGKDVIFGFDNDDMLQITGEFTATYNATTKAVAFKVGSTYNSVILKNFTATTFNINGEAYKISGNTFVKK